MLPPGKQLYRFIVFTLLYVFRQKNWGVPQAPAAQTTQTKIEPNQLDLASKQNLVVASSQKTGLNEEFSRICLEENGWDISNAANAFNNAQREGKIPLSAFEK